jgi:type IX secretion system PorP/SprF family membrane protein
MKSSKLFFLLLVCIMFDSVSGQQLPTFTQYREYYGIINPASVYVDYMRGVNDVRGADVTFLGLSSRYQWYKTPNPPSTSILHGEKIFRMRSGPNKSDMSFHPILGLQLIADRAGRISTQGAYLRAGMIFSKTPTKAGISVGFNVGFVQYNLRVEPGDDIQSINVGKLSSLHPDLGVGVFAYREIGGFDWFGDGDYIYGGFSMPQIYQNTIDFETDAFTYDKVRHLYLMGGYNKTISKGNYAETNIWVKKVGSLGLVFDINSRYTFQDRFIFGAGYSTANAYTFETAYIMPIGFETNKRNRFNQRLKIGLGFEMPTKYNSLFGNSMELNVSYSIPKDPRRSNNINKPRK